MSGFVFVSGKRLNRQESDYSTVNDIKVENYFRFLYLFCPAAYVNTNRQIIHPTTKEKSEAT